MALRIALLRSGKTGRESFYLVGANYYSEMLNSGTVAHDPDDLVTIVKIPTLPVQGALIRQVPSKIPDKKQEEQQLLLERAMKASTPPAEQPGAAMLPLKDSFARVWDEGFGAGEI